MSNYEIGLIVLCGIGALIAMGYCNGCDLR